MEADKKLEKHLKWNYLSRSKLILCLNLVVIIAKYHLVFKPKVVI